jgi:hypothetical protein
VNNTELIHHPVIVTLDIMKKNKSVIIVLTNVLLVLLSMIVNNVLTILIELPQLVIVLTVGLMLVLKCVTHVPFNV